MLATRSTNRIRPVYAAAALSCLLATPGSAQPQEEAVNGIIPYPTHETTLANGLKLIVMPMPSNGLVSYWSIVRTGSRDEFEPGRSGFAHFFEHMMFRGTERYPSDVYQRILTGIGADANAYTTDDLTAYHVSMTAADLERVVELEADRFKNLAYSEEDFRTEAGAVYGEYRKSRTDPLFALYEALMETAFVEHTYGHTTLGYEEDIRAMPSMYEYSLTFFDRYYRPENTILLVAGDVVPGDVARLIERHYGDWAAGYVAPDVPAEPPQREAKRVDVDYDGQTLPILWVAYKIGEFDPDDATRVAADLLAELAFGETSAAYKQLVIDEQAVEFLEAGANMNRDPSLLDIYTRVKNPADVEHVLGVIDSAVAAYRESPPDEARLADLKSRLRYGFLMGLDTPDAVASALARPIALSGGLAELEELYAAYANVTPADVERAAQAYLDPARRTVGVLRAGD